MRWYLSGDWDYLVILDLMISPLTRSARLVAVVVEGIVGDGTFWNLFSPLYSIVFASRRVFGTSEPLSRFFCAAALETSIVSACFCF